MGRVTVEKCLANVSSHFDLILLAALRAKELSLGKKSTIERKGSKNHVISLREIEEVTIDLEVLKKNLIAKINNPHVVDDDEENNENNVEILEELRNEEFLPGELEEIQEVESIK